MSMGTWIMHVIDNMSRRGKASFALVVDGCTGALSLWLSFVLIHGLIAPNAIAKFWWLLPISALLTVSVFYIGGLYRAILRFAGPKFFLSVIVLSTIVSGLLASIVLGYLHGQGGIPRRVFIIFAILLMLGTSGIRLVARWAFDKKAKSVQTPVIIYGAGSCGTQLFSAIRHGGQYFPLAFVDDDIVTQGTSIHGVRVYGTSKLEDLLVSKKINTVLLAMPSLTHNKRIEIINSLLKYHVVIKTTPTLSEIISGKASISEVHNVSVEDLMARPTVGANEELARSCVAGKSVMVTGAGGSIGSELCRQIVNRAPSVVVLYEMSESALFYIEQELQDRLRNSIKHIQIVPILGSVLDDNRLKETLVQFGVQTVFHAAAYKHVPMLESNPIEGVKNNVLGTKRVAEASGCANVESLVIISTDKAVRPTNLMGATKRLAELVVQAISEQYPRMNTCMVRFGNVLGSSGSVVPIFREQIKRGGPVTVTHKDMTRYFMTIPEASQLVMQAGAMAKNAEVFVLDMGEQVKIYDLACRMIDLSGFQILNDENPNGEIAITFTGLRPGEKMYEELAVDGRLEQTRHPKINRSVEPKSLHEKILRTVALIEKAVNEYDQLSMMQQLTAAIPEYKSSIQLKQKYPEIETPTEPQRAFSCDEGRAKID